MYRKAEDMNIKDYLGGQYILLAYIFSLICFPLLNISQITQHLLARSIAPHLTSGGQDFLDILESISYIPPYKNNYKRR